MGSARTLSGRARSSQRRALEAAVSRGQASKTKEAAGSGAAAQGAAAESTHTRVAADLSDLSDVALQAAFARATSALEGAEPSAESPKPMSEASTLSSGGHMSGVESADGSSANAEGG
eukprot:640939-Prymnesium_polylepis.1